MSYDKYHADGWVDWISLPQIKGWVICKKQPEKRAKVSIKLDGNEIASGVANIPRPDLIAVGIGVDDFSFSISIPSNISNKELARLRVFAYFEMDDDSVFEAEVMFLPLLTSAIINDAASGKIKIPDSIRNVYYVVGPTSSGKTTTALQLAKEMWLPVFHADLIYNMLKEKYNVLYPPVYLISYELWNDPKNFGISSWGDHLHIDDAKVEMYEKLIGSYNGDFIIEGFTLSFCSERSIVNKVIGQHRAILLRIDIPYEQWLKLFIKRNNSVVDAPHLSDYEKLRSCFSAEGAYKVMTFQHPDHVTAADVLKCPDRCKETKLEFITQEDFMRLVSQKLETNPLDKNGNQVGYWKDHAGRWGYHARVIELIQQYGGSSTTILELGTMGIGVVKNGHTIDYDKHVSYYPSGQPHYIHDVRRIPWPIPTGYYDWFIALRVFHHLAPVQRQCFEEARRIAKNVILIVPHQLPVGGGHAITPKDFLAWNNGREPKLVEDIGTYGYLYMWLLSTPSQPAR